MALTDNLISFWELEEASGTRVDAVTASANDLTDNNTVTQAVGKVGNAGQFTLANSEFLSRAHNASLATGNIDQTVCAWVYLDSEPGTDMTIVSKQRSGTGEYSLIWKNASQLFEWTMKDGGSTYVVIITSSTFGATNTATWYFVVAWFDSVAGIGYISVNDGAANSAAKTGTPATDATTDFSIGSRGNPAPTDYWDGRVDQAGLWKRVLTAAERTFLYNSGNGRSYAEIVAGGAAGVRVGPFYGPGKSPGYPPSSKRFALNWWPYSPPAGVAFDTSLMAAMYPNWPGAPQSQITVVASGMTPPEQMPN